MSKIKKSTFQVDGLHCNACELLIESKLSQKKGIQSVQISRLKRSLIVEYIGDNLTSTQLNHLFKDSNYRFTDDPQKSNQYVHSVKAKKFDLIQFLTSLVIAGLIILFFLALNRTGLAGLFSVNAQSSLAFFLVFGFLAGLSSCGALVGSLVLALSKHWSKFNQQNNVFLTKFQPNLMFNLGRLMAYAVMGAILGSLGNIFQFNFKFNSWLIVLVSLLMLIYGLEMLGINSLVKFKWLYPKFLSQFLTNEKNFIGKFMPLLIGALTCFIPCGFTLTVQSLALMTGDWFRGMLMLLLFVLGTTPALLLIGFLGNSLNNNQRLAQQFSQVAGILVLFFALYNLQAQFNVLTGKSFTSFGFKPKTILADKNQENLAPLVDGKQVLKMKASSSAYTPNKFTVRVNVPVKWEITDVGTSGCTNVIIAPNLFEGEIQLSRGQISSKEFIPTQIGTYKFSCWMGMVSGIIEVVKE